MKFLKPPPACGLYSSSYTTFTHALEEKGKGRINVTCMED